MSSIASDEGRFRVSCLRGKRHLNGEYGRSLGGTVKLYHCCTNVGVVERREHEEAKRGNNLVLVLGEVVWTTERGGEFPTNHAQAMTPDSSKATLLCEKISYDGDRVRRKRYGGGPGTAIHVLKCLFAIPDQRCSKGHFTHASSSLKCRNAVSLNGSSLNQSNK